MAREFISIQHNLNNEKNESKISNDTSNCFELSDMYEESLFKNHKPNGYISSEEENQSLNLEERKILNFKIKEEHKSGMLKSLEKQNINSKKLYLASSVISKKNSNFKSFKPKVDILNDDMFFSEEKEKRKSNKIAPLKRTQSQFTKWSYNLKNGSKTLKGKVDKFSLL